MASEYEVAKAVVTLIPSMKGSQATITKEITGAASGAGESAGKIMGESMSEGLDGSKKSMAQTALGITAGVLAAATAVGTAIMNAFKEVDAGLDTIRTKTGASGAQLEGMRDSMETLATSLPTSFADAGEAIGEVNTRFHLTGQELENLSGQFVKFAKINGTDITSSIDDVQVAMAAFNLESQEASTVLDVLNRTGQNTGADVAQLAQKVTQNATAFQQLGLDIYESITFMGQLETAGADSESVLSGLKRALKNATEEGKPFDKALADLEDTIKNGTSDMDGLTAAYDLFGRSGAGIYEAVKNGQISFTEMAKSTDILADSTGSLNSVFEEVTDPADEISEVMNRIKIAGADIAEGVMPVIAGALEGIAGIITGFGDFVDAAFAPKNDLERFIADIDQAISTTREAADASTERVSSVTDGMYEMQAYRDLILDLNEKTELNEFEQYQMKSAVEALSDSMPELGAAFDEVTGKINLTNDELEDMFDNALKIALQDALIEEITEAYKNLGDASIAAQSAEAAFNSAQKNTNTTYEEAVQKMQDLAAKGINYTYVLTEEEKALIRTHGTMDKTNASYEEVNEIQGENIKNLKEVAKEQDVAIDQNVMQAQTAEDVATAVKDAADEAVNASEVTEDMSEEMQAAEEAAQKLEAEFNSLRDSIQSSVENSITYLGEFSHAEATSTEEMIGNLSASNDYISGWITNMDLLGQHISEMSGTEQAAFQALYDDMLEKGPQTAGEAAAAMAQALSEGQGDFDAVVAEYSKSLDLTADSVKLAQYSSTGKAVAGEIATGMETGSSEVVEAAAQMTTDVTDEVDTGMEDAVSAYDGSLDAMESSTNTSANIIETRLSQMVLNLKKKMAEEIKGPNIKLPHFKLNGDFNLQTKSVPAVSVDWYAQGGIFTKPTIFATPYGLKGIGESGAEAVLPIDLLKNYVADAVSAVASNVFNIEMTVNGAESPEAWAATFARSLKQQMRMG